MSAFRFPQLCLLALLLISLSSRLGAAPLQPFNATYEANFNGIAVTATRSLSTRPDGLNELRFSAKSWLATIEESSVFRWDTTRLQPQRYEYHRVGMGRDRHATVSFDWHKQEVTNDVAGKAWNMAVPTGALDKLSYQLQLQSDMLHQQPTPTYAVADGGKLKQYSFEVVKEEQLQTPVGLLNTIKIKRIRADREQRTTYLWLALDWDYLLVRLRQQETDGTHYEINLASADLNGQAVIGH